jgi:hypothetical protein
MTIVLASVLALAGVAGAQERPADSRPADAPPAEEPAQPGEPQRAWGPAEAGLQVSAALVGAAAVGEPLRIDVALRNTGTTAAGLPAAKDVLVWLFVVQSTPDGRQSVYTERVFPAGTVEDFPDTLAGGQELRLPAADFGACRVFPYRRGLAVEEGYPTAGKDAEPARPLGTLKHTLSAGPLTGRLMLYLPASSDEPGASGRLIPSNTLRLTVAPPDLTALPEKERKAFVARLLGAFDKDAWAAKDACATAVQIGSAVVGDLAKAVAERSRPHYARMWLAAALCQIRDGRAAAALIGLLDDTLHGVRNVVAYHGPLQRNEKLNAAIVAAATGGKRPAMLTWAIRGFARVGALPETLRAAGLESDEPRTRAATAEALRRGPKAQTVPNLLALLADDNPQVRAAAAGSLAAAKARSRRAVGALVIALDRPDESTRQRVAAALCALTGRDAPYDPQAPREQRDAVRAAWKAWWAEARAEFE